MPKRIAFISTIPFDWGGSEELWAATAGCLRRQGYQIDIFKEFKVRRHPKLQSLVDEGCCLHTPDGYRLPPHARILNRFLPFRFQTSAVDLLSQKLKKTMPNLVVISQGWNWDGLAWVQACKKIGLPYVLICHQANIRGWPSDSFLPEVASAHLEAQGAFYVAKRVLERTEEMIGVRIPHGEVVRNPYNVSSEAALPWPSQEDGLRLACVGRIEFNDKGQDILVRVMGREKWKGRDVSISFYGDGINREGLQRLINLCGADSCKIVGYTKSIEEIWRTHHALVLPSREEGLPLVVVEAMHCGRPCIVTDVVGNAELLQESRSGFICPAPTADLLDETLERAWDVREKWELLGRNAADEVRKQIPSDPEKVFADRLAELTEGAR